MIRALLFAFLAAVIPASTPRAALDPAFEKVPFDQWLAGKDQGPFHWSASVPRVVLSFHQRALARVEIKLDGRDLQNRRANGQLLLLIQITDHDGTRYQNHGVVELSKLDENVKTVNLEYSQRTFLLPGDYRLAVAILDTATGEHSTRQEQFRVPAPQSFLSDAWRGLPAVEFLGKEDAPDGWFLPEVEGRLQWAAADQAGARIDVILNVTPHRTHTSDMAALIPTLKAISQTGSPSISEHVELLDLSRHRTAFDQELDQKQSHDIDWPRLKESLGESNTASIDVHSLSERHHDAQFFVGRVRSILRASQQPCVLVVLTPPVNFESGEDLAPISLEALPSCRAVYIRYRAPVESNPSLTPQFGERGRGSRMSGPMNRTARPSPEIDHLEATLKPLSPKTFDVDSPEGITKALVEIEKDLK